MPHAAVGDVVAANRDLPYWQERLQEHFRALRGKRTTALGDQPVFALEHGLSKTEVAAVAEGVRAHVREAAPSWEHRLPWTVYAAELGYLYAGDEYWHTFEERTPGWNEHGDRYWVRQCFHDFQLNYGGAEPTGPWARHFSIICWPITHAILPQDLQRQLAKILYELRHVTSSEVLASPRRLGELIGTRSWATSSRFQQLAQEPLLIGQIAAALLLQEEGEESSLILPNTLTRIGEDLDQERRARLWMRGARERARHQSALARATVPRGATHGDDGLEEEQSSAAAKIGLEPRLMLRPCADNENDWDVLVELPDFSYAMSKFPELREALGSRCRVAGSSGRPVARERLLRGSQRVLLRRWPSDDERLLEFEQPSPELDYLLGTECSLRPGPAWLFKIASDHLGYELRGAHVRAGQRYVLVRRDAPDVGSHPALHSTRLSCEDVHAFLLDLPEAIAPDLEEALSVLGLSQAGRIRVWPTGLTPARWDGDGGVEWLHTETPCVALQADYQVEAFEAELGGQTIDLTPSGTGAPVFLELPDLPVGRHALRVAARGPVGALANGANEPAVLEIQIREPRIWSPENGSQGALMVIVDPHAPSLEQLWEGDVGIEVHGPPGRLVHGTLCLYDRGCTTPRLERKLPGMRLPVTEDHWRACYEQFKEDREVRNAYDCAHSGEVRFTAGELGAFMLTVEREFTPLRWILRRTRQGYFLRVIDDTGADSAAEVQFFAFGTPDVARSIDVLAHNSGDGAASYGGLYVVSATDHDRAIADRAIVIPAEVRSLRDLNVEPRLRSRKRRQKDLMDLVRSVDRWAGARLTGDILSQHMRLKVLASMSRELFSIICGRQWGEAEHAVAQGTADAVPIAQRAVSSRREEAKCCAVLARDAADLAASTPEDRTIRLADLAEKFLGLRPTVIRNVQVASDHRPSRATLVLQREAGPVSPQWLSEFALRLASWPAGILTWAGTHAQTGLSRLVEVPALARAARFMVLVISREKASTEADTGFLHDGWVWS